MERGEEKHDETFALTLVFLRGRADSHIAHRLSSPLYLLPKSAAHAHRPGQGEGGWGGEVCADQRHVASPAHGACLHSRLSSARRALSA